MHYAFAGDALDSASDLLRCRMVDVTITPGCGDDTVTGPYDSGDDFGATTRTSISGDAN